MTQNLRQLLFLTLAPLTVFAAARQNVSAPAAHKQKQTSAQPASSLPIARTWTPPDTTKIPPGPEGQAILLGFHIFTQTPKYAAPHVGNELSCGDCHLQGGTMSYGIALVGTPNWFPMFSERAKREISLEDRIQECVTRSENGAPFSHDGPEMNALFSYLRWISQQGESRKQAPVRGLASVPALNGDPARGEIVYKETCATCHGKDGAGVAGILPALWGPAAYNQVAGMNQVSKMAAFVLRNMPQNNPGSLTPQQAYDVAAYVASKPH